MFVTGLRSAVNRAFVTAFQPPSTAFIQAFPNRASRALVAETPSRLKSSTNE